MTKKHFKRIAEELRAVRPMVISPCSKKVMNTHMQQHAVWAACVTATASALEHAEPKFDRLKFIDACYE